MYPVSLSAIFFDLFDQFPDNILVTVASILPVVKFISQLTADANREMTDMISVADRLQVLFQTVQPLSV
jgi:hypothetical protein